MQKTFISPHWANRRITVVINRENETIQFLFPDEGDRLYYDIPIDEWVKDVKEDQGKRWVSHMEEKVWFTSNIRKFINECLGLPDSGKILLQDKWTEKDEQLKQRSKINGGYISVSDIIDVNYE
jgi:hypothetical protein